jgi:hypothetical protein
MSNGYGLYDVAGNVSEWCWDLAQPNYRYSQATNADTRGPSASPYGQSRIYRGGSWGFAPENTRCSERFWTSANPIDDDIGFRCARSNRDVGPPTGVNATDGQYAHMIRVTWNASAGATGYIVLRSASNDAGTAAAVSAETPFTAYDDMGVAPGATNYYWVKAGDTGGWSRLSAPDMGYTVPEARRFALSVEAIPTNGGTVDLNPDRDPDGKYREGTMVTLAPGSSPGYHFKEWRGSASGTVAQITLAVDADKSVTAVFEASGDAYESDDAAIAARPWSGLAPQTHSIRPPGDQDWVAFTLSTTTNAVIETSGDSGDTRLWLFDADLNELASDDDSGQGFFSRIDRTLAAGTYYLKVDGCEADREVGQYDLSVTFSTADRDTDGDGMIDSDEVVAGTDPRSASSVLKLVDVRQGTEGLVLRWSSVHNRVYDLDRSTNMARGFDHTVVSNLNATPPVNVHTDATAVGSGPYYLRVRTR